MSAESIHQIRLLIGDIDTSDELFSDAQITSLESLYGGVYATAAAACNALAAKFAREVDATVDDVRASNSQKYEHYVALAKTLSMQAARNIGATPYAGGISRSDKQTYETDSDRVEPAFTVELHTNRNASNQRRDTD